MPVIDFHNHFYPPEYIEALRSGRSVVKTTEDGEGNPVVHYPGDYNVLVRGHRDIDFRERVIREHRIAVQVLTFTTPGIHVEAPDVAVEWAAMVNDAFAAIVADRSDHFTALATLPLNDPAASVKELERACRDLELPGAMLFSNVNGVGLDDRRFWPLYEKANALGAVMYIHPVDPVGVEAMTEYWLMPLVGFPFDTTLAAAKLVFSGVVERYPRIRWALGHLGGAIPYLAERLDRGYHAFQECRANIARPPSDYLKTFYYDTVNFDPNAVQLAIEFAGPDHLLAGSDYPHRIGSLRMMLETIEGLPLSETEKAAILGGNAATLLGL